MDSSPPHAARVYALESIAFHDATVACWDAKYGRGGLSDLRPS